MLIGVGGYEKRELVAHFNGTFFIKMQQLPEAMLESKTENGDQ